MSRAHVSFPKQPAEDQTSRGSTQTTQIENTVFLSESAFSALICGFFSAFTSRRSTIPHLDRRFVVIVVVEAQHAERAGAEQQATRERHGLADPPRRKYAQHVTVREAEDVARQALQLRDKSIHALRDRGRRLAARAAVAE